MNSNSKTFAMFVSSVLLLAMLVSSVGALSLNSVSGLTFTRVGQSQNLTVSSASTSENFNVTSYQIVNTNSNLAFTISPLGTLNGTHEAIFNVTLTSASDFSAGDSAYGTFNVNVTSTGGNESTNGTASVSYIKSFCQNGDVGNGKLDNQNLTMDVISITNDGEGSDNQWYPLDTISVKVKVYNHNPDEDVNGVLQLGLYKEGHNSNLAGDLKWVQDSDQVYVTIPSDGSETYTFEFKVNPDADTGSYRLMLKSYSDDVGENKLCLDHSSGLSNNYYDSITIKKETSSSKMVVIDTSALPSVTTASCAQQTTITPTVYNIGTSDFKDQFFVTLNIPALGIKINRTVYGTLNSGDSAQVPLTFNIPRNADQTSYPVYMNIYYGYNQGNGAYLNDYRYVSSNSFNTVLAVSGNCVYATPATTQIEAQLQSGGKAGEPLVIQATVTNTGNKTVSYNFGAEGYSSWSTLSDISPMNVTLIPGQSQTVIMNMNVNKDATGGDKQFYLDVYSNGYLITQQPLSLTVTPRFSLASITGGVISGDSLALWTFNIVLVVAIIVILVIVLRKRRTA